MFVKLNLDIVPPGSESEISRHPEVTVFIPVRPFADQIIVFFLQINREVSFKVIPKENISKKVVFLLPEVQ